MAGSGKSTPARAPASQRDVAYLTRLWGSEVPPLGVGPLIEVNTAEPVDVAALASLIISSLAS